MHILSSGRACKRTRHEGTGSRIHCGMRRRSDRKGLERREFSTRNRSADPLLVEFIQATGHFLIIDEVVQPLMQLSRAFTGSHRPIERKDRNVFLDLQIGEIALFMMSSATVATAAVASTWPEIRACIASASSSKRTTSGLRCHSRSQPHPEYFPLAPRCAFQPDPAEFRPSYPWRQ